MSIWRYLQNMQLHRSLVILKVKSAIHIAQAYGGRTRNFTGVIFRAHGYFVSTVGRDEKVIRF
jgi:hypothetical protein